MFFYFANHIYYGFFLLCKIHIGSIIKITIVIIINNCEKIFFLKKDERIVNRND